MSIHAAGYLLAVLICNSIVLQTEILNKTHIIILNLRSCSCLCIVFFKDIVIGNSTCDGGIDLISQLHPCHSCTVADIRK